MSAPVVSSLIANAVKGNLAAYFESFIFIQEKGGAFREGAPMHIDQQKTADVIAWCREHKKPCRIQKLKPRRGGSSTISTAALYVDLMEEIKRGCIMGGSEFQGNSLFSMLRLMATKDRIPRQRAQVLDAVARFPNGSTCDRINASNPTAGLAAGYEFMIVTELAKWASEGVAAADQVLNGALKCVPYLPGTTIIIESTADGVGNEYHRRYLQTISFEELKAGKEGFVRIFTPWFEFPDYVKEPNSEGIQSEDNLSQDERDLSAQYKLDLSRIAWMRYAIRELCGGDLDDFKENYPFNDVECFLLTGRKVFSIVGIKKMKDDLYKFPAVTGALDLVRGNNRQVLWRPASPADCNVLRWEPPMDGQKYLVAVDPATGASNTIGDDPDNHSVQVWRAGYIERGQWVAPRLVAQLVDDYELWLKDRKYTLQWDIDVLEEYVWKLMCYYQAILVPEMNMERGMVELIKLRGGNIIIQDVPNRRENTQSARYGVYTYGGANGGIRAAYIGELVKGIREYAVFDPIRGRSQERCEIHSAIVLDECETFIKLKSGREEAMQKKKDDNVLCASIALSCIDVATTYHRPQGIPKGDPFDDRDDVMSSRRVQGTYT